MKNKKVLVIGSGGREHALAWKLSQSPQVSKIYISPGNGGTSLVGKNINIEATDKDRLLAFAKSENIDLTVVGQEAASEAGVVDLFKENGLTIFGPTKNAAKIESSKAFSKDLMKRQNIPTAKYKNFDDPKEALKYVKSKKPPVVIKADGLAAGKGVIVARSLKEAEQTIKEIMVDKVFGKSGNMIVVEDFLEGDEVSVHALCDGGTAVLFPPSQDHKQIYDNDEGPNTGGMGVIAPVSWVEQSQLDYVQSNIVQPVLNGLKTHGSEFRGCLYPGLMINKSDINVIEFNSRFGDPEAEVYMRLINCDFYQLLNHCALGKLQKSDIAWQNTYAVSVVLASAGYPSSSSKDDLITGISEAEKLDEVVIFHAGTKQENGNYYTAGGRVLNVTATGKSLDKAIEKAYEAVSLIKFEGMQYRTDIGRRLRTG